MYLDESIVIYDVKKSICKIAFTPNHMPNIKTYIRKEPYAETSDEIGFALNLDHFTLFSTAKTSWVNAKATCENHNAVLYLPDNENAFKMIHNKFGKVPIYIGMYWEDETWKDYKGNGVNYFFFAPNEPKNRTCGGITGNSKMMAIGCTVLIE